MQQVFVYIHTMHTLTQYVLIIHEQIKNNTLFTKQYVYIIYISSITIMLFRLMCHSLKLTSFYSCSVSGLKSIDKRNIQGKIPPGRPRESSHFWAALVLTSHNDWSSLEGRQKEDNKDYIYIWNIIILCILNNNLPVLF